MASIFGPRPPVDQREELVQMARDSVLSASAVAVVTGYGLGVFISFFTSMISAETATQSMGAADFFRYSVKNAHRLGANFALFSFLFGGIEAAMEKRRGKKDAWNQTLSGGVIGGAYGWRYYKRPGLVGGAVGGAALSMLMEKMLALMGLAPH